MTSLLSELIETLDALPEEDREEITREAVSNTDDMLWVPNPGPQTDAYLSEADVLLYGGEPGGGKSQLILGLAFNEHKRSLIMRREYGDLERLIDDAIKINGSKNGFNGSPPPKLRISEDQVINFRAAHRVGDEQSTMGQGRDLLGIDEATHFAESQIRFMMGWVRSEDPKQRCRTVLATNPPLKPEGMWVVDMFAPWLDEKYHNPAKPGELRWVISDEDGNDLWVDGPDDIRVINGKGMRPTSRTYIPASVRDNPYYVDSDYERQLDAMPEPYRSLLMGGFKTAFEDLYNQCVPTSWIQAAQSRWTNKPPEGIPMCAIGVDASGGGKDPMVLAPRYDGWYAPLIKVPGKEIPSERAGTMAAGHVVSIRHDNALVVVDMGGGYGGPLYEHLHKNEIDTYAYRGAESTARRSRDGKMPFTNVRSAAYWLFREALDPDQPGGSPISLPDDPRLLATLAAPTFEVTSRGIQLESKEKVVNRLGYSTDEADAVVMAWWEGARQITHALDWIDRAERKKRGMTKVVSSGRMPLSAKRRR